MFAGLFAFAIQAEARSECPDTKIFVYSPKNEVVVATPQDLVEHGIDCSTQATMLVLEENLLELEGAILNPNDFQKLKTDSIAMAQAKISLTILKARLLGMQKKFGLSPFASIIFYFGPDDSVLVDKKITASQLHICSLLLEQLKNPDTSDSSIFDQVSMEKLYQNKVRFEIVGYTKKTMQSLVDFSSNHSSRQD